MSDDDEVESVPDSLNFLTNGERKMMRVFIVYEQHRCSMDVPYGKRVSQVKKLVQNRFFIQPNRAQLGDENQEKNRLVLVYAGAELPDHWVLSDMGIVPGSTLRAFIKEELDPVFHFFVAYNQDNISVMDRIRLREFSVANLRALASRQTGLPISVFRLISPANVEMYDCNSLDSYKIRPGDTIRVDTWDGWNDFLNLAALGFTSHVLSKINNQDEIMIRFQMKVALYMASHFGHVELALTLIKNGIRSDEPVGEHPLRQWNQLDRHVDLRKCPVHEAVENGQLSVLRSFVHTNVCCIMARDGNGLQPINIALRQKKKACASFLLTKQWSRIPYNNMSIPLAIFARMKAWTERSRDKVQIFIGGSDKNSMRKKVMRDNPLVGQKVYVTGFSEQWMSSKSKMPQKTDRSNWAVEEYYRNVFSENPEEYFKKSMKAKNRGGRGAGGLARLRQTPGGTQPPNNQFGGHQPKLSVASKMGSDRRASHTEEGGPTGESLMASADQHQGDGVSHAHMNASPDGKTVTLPPEMLEGGRGEKGSRKLGRAVSTRDIPGIVDDSQSRPSSGKTGSLSVAGGARFKSGPPGAHVPGPASSTEHSQPPPTTAGGTKKKAMSASVLAKAKATESSVPLPLNTSVDTPRPFFHVSPGRPDIPKLTKELYERKRGINSREFAIRCMSVANTFREKSWLHQVRMATLFAEQGIKKPMKYKTQSMFNGTEEASA